MCVATVGSFQPIHVNNSFFVTVVLQVRILAVILNEPGHGKWNFWTFLVLRQGCTNKPESPASKLRNLARRSITACYFCAPFGWLVLPIYKLALSLLPVTLGADCCQGVLLKFSPLDHPG